MGIISGRHHFGVDLGIISGSASFRGRFGDHFRVGDHFGVGIISGAVQCTRSKTKQSIKVTTQGTHSHVSVFALYFFKFFFGQVITLK